MAIVCEILVKKPNKLGIHRAGDTVEGTVKYVLNRTECYQNITLCLIGKGMVIWSTSTLRTSNTCTGKEKFEAQFISLLNRTDEESVTVEKGEYSHQFSFTLQSDLPPSFRDGRCTISYNLVIEFDRKSYFSRNQKFSKEIFVCSDYKPYSSAPIIFGLKRVLIKPFSLKPHIITIKVELRNTLIAPGQYIPLIISVNNNTNVDIVVIKHELIRYTRYRANAGNKKKHKKIIKESTQTTKGVKSCDIIKTFVKVPTVADLRTIKHSFIVKRDYKIKVTAILPLPHRKASLKIPIILGEPAEELVIEDVASEDWQPMVEDTKI